MNKTTKLCLMAMMLLLVSCVTSKAGSNEPTQVKQIGETTTLRTFDAIDVAGAMMVVYEQGDSYSARVEATEKAFELLTVFVKHNKLHITTKQTARLINFENLSQTIKVYVTCPKLNKINMTGSGTFQALNTTVVDRLNIDMTGSGSVKMAGIVCNDLNVQLTGSGNVRLTKVFTHGAKSDVTGSGQIRIDDFKADNASSQVTGSGSISLKGTVGTHSKTVTGSGNIDTSGLKQE